MTEYFRSEEQLQPFIMFPKFLLKEDLNETAKLVYLLLLDRARLSKSNDWTDENGCIFLIYPIQALATDLGKSDTTIKTALSALEAKDLIVRKRGAPGMPNKIYVKVSANPSALQKTKSSLSDSQKTGSLTGRKLPTNKNKANNNKGISRKSFQHSLESL